MSITDRHQKWHKWQGGRKSLRQLTRPDLAWARWGSITFSCLEWRTNNSTVLAGLAL